MTIDPGRIPEAWPLLLTLVQTCAYLSVSEDTFKRICPVRPVALGVRRWWRRLDIDEWIAGLPAQLKAGEPIALPTPIPQQLAGEERRLNALERASQRATRNSGRQTWQNGKARRTSNG